MRFEGEFAGDGAFADRAREVRLSLRRGALSPSLSLSPGFAAGDSAEERWTFKQRTLLSQCEVVNAFSCRLSIDLRRTDDTQRYEANFLHQTNRNATQCGQRHGVVLTCRLR